MRPRKEAKCRSIGLNAESAAAGSWFEALGEVSMVIVLRARRRFDQRPSAPGGLETPHIGDATDPGRAERDKSRRQSASRNCNGEHAGPSICAVPRCRNGTEQSTAVAAFPGEWRPANNLPPCFPSSWISNPRGNNALQSGK